MLVFNSVMHCNICVEAQWLGGGMLDSRSREPGHESPTCIMAPLMAARCGSVMPRQKQNPCIVLDIWQKNVIYYFILFSLASANTVLLMWHHGKDFIVCMLQFPLLDAILQ